MSDLFNALCTHVGKQPTRKGEVYLPCPNCGKPKSHFSFSTKGAHCFLCGYNPSLSALADKLGLPDNTPYASPVERPRPAPRHKPWQQRPYELVANFAVHPLLAQKWLAYKPLLLETIKRHALGYGVFPGLKYESKTGWQTCTHPRLIVPLFDGDVVAGFRCRAVECQCPKWLSPGGSRLVLYNARSIEPGQPVAIVENPIDALLVVDHWHMAAVATLGVSIWNDDYTAVLLDRRPSAIIVCYDNDVPGQTTNPRIIADWKARRRARNLPDDETKFLSGIRLANRLRAAGLPAQFYQWPASAPEKADIGSLFHPQVFPQK